MMAVTYPFLNFIDDNFIDFIIIRQKLDIQYMSFMQVHLAVSASFSSNWLFAA